MMSSNVSNCQFRSRSVLSLAKALLLIAAVNLAGCAYTVHETPVNYRYSAPAPVDLQSSSQRLRIGDIVDGRGIPPQMIFQSRHVNGDPASGGDQAEKAIAEIVRDALAQGLTAAHVPLVQSNESLVLTGVLLSSTRDWLGKGYLETETDAKLYVTLSLISPSRNQVVWQENIRVFESITLGSPSVPEHMFNALLDKLIFKLLTNDEFVAQLR